MHFGSHKMLSALFWGLPGGSDSEVSTCNAGDLGLIPGLGKMPRRRAWQPTPVFLPSEFHGPTLAPQLEKTHETPLSW